MIRSFCSVLVLLLLFQLPALAEVELRGMGSISGSVSQESADQMASELGNDHVRLQLGFDSEMDGLRGAAYTARLTQALNEIESQIEIYGNAGLLSVVELYSPPGGFETRVAPAHHAMFSDPTLVAEYLDALVLITQRLASNPNVAMIGINNEPALRSDLLCDSCADWGEVAQQAVSTIRAIDPDLKLIVKSLYGNPTLLRSLPLFNDANVLYGYHAYLFLRYQHAGLDEIPRNVKRPKRRKIWNRYFRSLSRFARSYQRAKRRGLIPDAPERAPMAVPEFGVSNLALRRPTTFLSHLLSFIEGDYERRKRLARRVTKTRRQRRNLRVVSRNLETKQWANHIMFESRVWDPRYVADQDGNFILQGYASERAQLLKEYFARE